jgi:hypothetical protein
VEGWKRYHIDSLITPSKYLQKKKSHPFWPEVKKFGLIKSISEEAIHLSLAVAKRECTLKEASKTLQAKPCIYGVFETEITSGKFGGLTPQRDKCTGCMRCVQEYPEFCSVTPNKNFYDFQDSYLNHNYNVSLQPLPTLAPFYTIWQEATNGKVIVKGMGYKGYFAGENWDAYWTDMSEIVRPTRDGIEGREYISTEVNLGRKDEKIVFQDDTTFTINNLDSVPLPIIFDYLPSNINSVEIQLSIARASEKTDTLFISDDKSLIENFYNNLILLIHSETQIQNYDITIFNKVRILQFYHQNTMNESLNLYYKLRELSSRPIFVRMKAKSNLLKDVIELVQAGIDGIHLEADYHGNEFENHSPRFVSQVLENLNDELIKNGLRKHISIITSGGIILTEHVFKALLIGSEACAINTTVLTALEYLPDGEWIKPQDCKIKNHHKLDIQWGSQRLINFLSASHKQIIELLGAMGGREINRFVGESGRLMNKKRLASAFPEKVQNLFL